MKSQTLPLPTVIIRDNSRAQWLAFSRPQRIFCVRSVEEVVTTLGQIETEVNRHDLWAAGWVSYEASSAFNAALVTQPPSDFPLMWMALFESCEPVDPASILNVVAENKLKDIVWTTEISEKKYQKKIGLIKKQLFEGNTYQVNFTLRHKADLSISAEQTFINLASDARYGAFIDTGDYALCSASPELFFTKTGTGISCRPMKGTAARGRSSKEDLELRDELAVSEKNIAENLMIVDMIRNDLGKIADPGSVKVDNPFAIEKYPTAWQMTSTVSARSNASLTEIFTALFPCASITGAPKANTMKIIRSLETEPRNIYTGTIGFIRPDMSMQFNVAIRTLLLHKVSKRAEYGVGGGIVWDSDAQSEFEECRIKSRVLNGARPTAPDLLETLLWTPQEGYFLLDYHMCRLQSSGQYFDYMIDLEQIKEALTHNVEGLTEAQRVRLLVNEAGDIQVTTADFVPIMPNLPYRVVLAFQPVEENNTFLYHKTSERSCYNYFAQQYPEYDDVLLHNRQGQITESLIANLVVEIDGKKYTPPVTSGLLAGTYRQYMLDTQQVVEKVISPETLANADNIYLVNSVRKIWPVMLDIG